MRHLITIHWYAMFIINTKNLSSQFSDIDECASSPCIHGTCEDAINNFTCICDMGYTDILCDQGIYVFWYSIVYLVSILTNGKQSNNSNHIEAWFII